MKPAFVAPLVLALAACGGGAGGVAGAGGTSAIGVPGASPTAPPGALVTGSVVELPVDAYGPAAIAGVTYASADATKPRRSPTPSSRYLAAGGIGLSGEGVGIATASSATAAFESIESAFLSEKTASPAGAHFTNLADPSHVWAGLAAAGPDALPFNFNVDFELITPSAAGSTGGASGYTAAGCPPGIVDNNS